MIHQHWNKNIVYTFVYGTVSGRSGFGYLVESKYTSCIHVKILTIRECLFYQNWQVINNYYI